MFTFLGNYSIFSSKGVLKQCYPIQKNTHNLNPIFNIAICFTKKAKHAKTLSNIWSCWETMQKTKNHKPKFVLCIMYKFHNPYFVNFVLLFCIMYKFHNSYFVYFIFFIFGIIYIFYILYILYFLYCTSISTSTNT